MKSKKSEYSERLRDPRWQKKRLEIMQRDEFTCQKCMDSESTMNVHHCFYETNAQPWDYPNDSLITLCEECHLLETESCYTAKKTFAEVFSRMGFLSVHFSDVSSIMHEEQMRGNLGYLNGAKTDIFASALGWAISNIEMRELMEEKYFEHLNKRSYEYKKRTQEKNK